MTSHCFFFFQQYATKEGKYYERLKLWILYSGVEMSEGEEFDLGNDDFTGFDDGRAQAFAKLLLPSRSFFVTISISTVQSCKRCPGHAL